MVPLSATADMRTTFGPYILPRFNLFTAAEVSGQPASGYSSGQALEALQSVAAETLPDGYRLALSGASYQQQAAGDVTFIAFGLAFVFAFLFLVGQFESWLQPLAIMLSVLIAGRGRRSASRRSASPPASTPRSASSC